MALSWPREQLLLLSYLLLIKLIIHHIMVLSGAQRNSTICFFSSKNVLHTLIILLSIITIVSGHMINMYTMNAYILHVHTLFTNFYDMAQYYIITISINNYSAHRQRKRALIDSQRIQRYRYAHPYIYGYIYYILNLNRKGKH